MSRLKYGVVHSIVKGSQVEPSKLDAFMSLKTFCILANCAYSDEMASYVFTVCQSTCLVLNFLVTVKAEPHECVIRTGLL